MGEILRKHGFPLCRVQVRTVRSNASPGKVQNQHNHSNNFHGHAAQ